ncbi:MAG: hypothetical protein ACI95S_000581 [Dinoroseobacter sp.]|jgi:hypothetical protein
MSLRDWLGVREVPDWMKARWLGAGFTVIATIIAAMILARLIEAIVTGSSVNVRNYGLLLSGVVGAILVGWRNAVAGRQADLQDEALFNDKINAAAEDLAARRQVTRPTFTTKDEENDKKQESILTEWEDDMVTRAAAIDRLEGLARERPLEVPRIAALLSVYARELSKQKGLTPKDHWIPKDGASIPALREWARRLKPIRSDMEKAVQTLGRLREIEGQDDLSIDLREANLQGFDLQGLNFDTARMSSARMEGANLDDTQIQGADLSWAQMQGSYLREAKMHGADLFIAQIDQSTLVSESTFSGAGVALSDWSSANLSPSHVAVMFGDASVKLPFDNPEWWPDIAFDFDSLISDSPWDIEFAHWRAAPDTYDWNTRRGHYTDDGWINPDNPPPEWKP